jgi:multisubunit Na+/H+ antiporter MnhC subunit
MQREFAVLGFEAGFVFVIGLFIVLQMSVYDIAILLNAVSCVANVAWMYYINRQRHRFINPSRTMPHTETEPQHVPRLEASSDLQFRVP